MYFVIKYNIFHEYFINGITTAINTNKNVHFVFDFGQREIISFFTLDKGEHSIIYSKCMNIETYVERGEKKSQTPGEVHHC